MLELTGFGLSLEQPTVTEQMMSTAAKTSVLAFLPQVRKSLCFIERNALMRVMVVASCRLAAHWRNATGGPSGEALIRRGLAG